MSVTIMTFAARCGAATVRCGRASATISAREREQQQQRRQVPAPAGPRGDEAGHQRRVGQRGRLAPAPALQRAVGQRRERQQDSPASRTGSAKLMRRAACGPAATAARRGCAGAQRRLAAAQVAGERRAASRPRWRARRGRRRRGAAPRRPRSRSAAAAAAKRSRTRRWRVFDVHLAARSPGRPARGRRPAGARCSRGSRISTASTPWRARSVRSGAFPVALAAEVGDDDDEPALARRARRRARSAAPSDVAPGAVGARGSRAQLGEQRRAGRAGPGAGAASRGSPPPKASTPSRLPRRVATWPIGERDALGDVGLAPVGGAEGHRGGHVEHEPRGQRALADVHAHVRLAAGARSRSSRCGARRRPGSTAGSSPARCPPPTCGVRCSPGTRLSTRCITARSSERRTACGTGPGPGPVGRALGRGRDRRARGSRQPPSAQRAPTPAPASSSTSAPPANADGHLLLLLASSTAACRGCA